MAAVEFRLGQPSGREAVASSSGRQPSFRPVLHGRRYGIDFRQRAALQQQGAPVSSLPAAPTAAQDELAMRSEERIKRLMTLVEMRRLYRNCIRARSLLELPSPVYRTPPPTEEVEVQEAGSGLPGVDQQQQAAERARQEEEKALKAAIDVVAEMALTAEKLKGSLRALPSGFGAIFAAGTERESEARVREVARTYASQLRERLAAELPGLPVTGDAALSAIEARNAKYSRRAPSDAGDGAGGADGHDTMWQAQRAPRASARERFEAAERVAGEIIANNIKPALKKASEQDLVEVVTEAGDYLKGLWVRLNGGQPSVSAAEVLAKLQLPMPASTAEQSELAISQTSLDLEAFEKQLQEASRQRENKLRKAGLPGRVQMAMQLKGLDAEVLRLSSRLAVKTLLLEMEHIYSSLEAEALDCFSEAQRAELITRDGSTNELALLVAEFALLDEQLTVLSGALEGDGPDALGLGALVNDEVLGKLAADIPDMRSRVGVADQAVFGGQGFSLTRARLQIKESLDKVMEAVNFLTRGLKLLGSDVANAARLFGKAALGNTLKPREVSAIRRTARDLLTFIPFTIILIIPLTPLGHVLVFGFIQRYFPSFFPSQFSTKRQEIMVRYEELERQLLVAQANAEAAEEEVELARARVAVARLTAPDTLGLGMATMSMDGVSMPAAGGNSSGGGGTAGAAGSAAAAGGSAGGAAGPVRVLDSVDEAQLHQATRKVKILEEQLGVIREDVDLGDEPLVEQEEQQQQPAGTTGSGGRKR